MYPLSNTTQPVSRSAGGSQPEQKQAPATRPAAHPAFLPFRSRHQRNMMRYLIGFLVGMVTVLFILYLVTL